MKIQIKYHISLNDDYFSFREKSCFRDENYFSTHAQIHYSIAQHPLESYFKKVFENVNISTYTLIIYIS